VTSRVRKSEDVIVEEDELLLELEDELLVIGEAEVCADLVKFPS
jgi:hypothetical protein